MILGKGPPKTWSQEPGYVRGILLPFGTDPVANVQVQLTTIAAGESVSPHHHVHQIECIYFLRGQCDLIFGSKSIPLEAGDLIIITPGETHAALNDTPDPVTFLTFKLEGTPDDTVWEE